MQKVLKCQKLKTDLKLLRGEGPRMVAVLIPESVSFPQIEKLLAEDAGKRGTCG